MYIIVGLGNPESEYAKTRHNMGFNVINALAKAYHIEVQKSKFKGLYGDGMIEGEKVVLLKPQTFMNLSGESVKEILHFYKASETELIVVYDDITIAPGSIRIRKKGSAGGHNGMKSIIHHIHTEDFCRIRVGIGRPMENVDMISHVIGYVPEEERLLLNQGVDKAKDAIIEIIKHTIDSAMNKFN